ncbi:hypothetical protein Bca4012_010129 [Brassica carinata]
MLEKKLEIDSARFDQGRTHQGEVPARKREDRDVNYKRLTGLFRFDPITRVHTPGETYPHGTEHGRIGCAASKAAKKRKQEVASLRTKAGGGPVKKQKRVSTYFRRPTLVDEDKNDELHARVASLEKVVGWMEKKLLRRKKTGIPPKKGVFFSGRTLKKKKKKIPSSPEEDSLSDEDNEEPGDARGDSSASDGRAYESEPEGDGGRAKDSSADASEDEPMEENVVKSGSAGGEPHTGDSKGESEVEGLGEQDEQEEEDERGEEGTRRTRSR